MKKAIDCLKQFHKKCGEPINSSINLKDRTDKKYLRMVLLIEEFSEYLKAEQEDDIVEISDALADMIYIICGTAITYGIPLDKIFDEVHKSNMSKFDGGTIKRKDGKVLKGRKYKKPKIKEILK